MVVSYEGGTKSLVLICVWFPKRFLWPEGEVCVCVYRGEGNGCVPGEKVTNAGGSACLGKCFFFFSLCCRPENRRGNSNQNNPCALA